MLALRLECRVFTFVWQLHQLLHTDLIITVIIQMFAVIRAALMSLVRFMSGSVNPSH